VSGRWILLAGLALGAAPTVRAQGLRADSASAAARAALRPAELPAEIARRPGTADAAVFDSTAGLHRNRVGTAALGFVAGAAAGVVIAYLVDRGRSSGDGRLENYIAIPLALGTATFMTVFVALGN
jgi:hypothetical protein